MTDTAVAAPILSCAIGLMGAVVAGLSVYFNYKGRHNQIRQVVYGKQMDAYFEITEAMGNLYNAAQNMLALGNHRLKTEDGRQQFRTALRDEHDDFTGKVNRLLIVLPSKVKAALDNFNDTLVALCAPAEDRPAGAEESADPAADLGRAYERAINCIRHHLAIDSLVRGMLREMGIGNESVMLQQNRAYKVGPLVPVSRATR
ncbi:MAG TPA: hypothetical protein VL371_10565 [Gemmataceae bacterium]|jgi:hypothetical protein|nr:hypothetical protein [Gemmataceae bacterium]